MAFIRHTTSLVLLAAASFTTLAQTAAEHAQHHPVSVAQAQPAMPKGAMAPKSEATNAMSAMPSLAAMDERMKEMQAMHEKMVSAKSPEERNALMVDHMKTMQVGMGMMNQMAGKGATGGKGDMHGGKAMPGNMAERQQMMEKRMDMMQSMMQMMMDRMPAAAGK